MGWCVHGACLPSGGCDVPLGLVRLPIPGRQREGGGPANSADTRRTVETPVAKGTNGEEGAGSRRLSWWRRFLKRVHS